MYDISCLQGHVAPRSAGRPSDSGVYDQDFPSHMIPGDLGQFLRPNLNRYVPQPRSMRHPSPAAPLRRSRSPTQTEKLNSIEEWRRSFLQDPAFKGFSGPSASPSPPRHDIDPRIRYPRTHAWISDDDGDTGDSGEGSRIRGRQSSTSPRRAAGSVDSGPRPRGRQLAPAHRSHQSGSVFIGMRDAPSSPSPRPHRGVDVATSPSRAQSPQRPPPFTSFAVPSSQTATHMTATTTSISSNGGYGGDNGGWSAGGSRGRGNHHDDGGDSSVVSTGRSRAASAHAPAHRVASVSPHVEAAMGTLPQFAPWQAEVDATTMPSQRAPSRSPSPRPQRRHTLSHNARSADLPLFANAGFARSGAQEMGTFVDTRVPALRRASREPQRFQHDEPPRYSVFDTSRASSAAVTPCHHMRSSSSNREHTRPHRHRGSSKHVIVLSGTSSDSNSRSSASSDDSSDDSSTCSDSDLSSLASTPAKKDRRRRYVAKASRHSSNGASTNANASASAYRSSSNGAMRSRSSTAGRSGTDGCKRRVTVVTAHLNRRQRQEQREQRAAKKALAKAMRANRKLERRAQEQAAVNAALLAQAARAEEASQRAFRAQLVQRGQAVQSQLQKHGKLLHMERALLDDFLGTARPARHHASHNDDDNDGRATAGRGTSTYAPVDDGIVRDLDTIASSLLRWHTGRLSEGL